MTGTGQLPFADDLPLPTTTADERQITSVTSGADTILIVMATYNGAEYLAEQLRSLQAQTWQDWCLLVRDDGSDDDTRQILRAFIAEDARIHLLEAPAGNVGATRSFEFLLEAAWEMGVSWFALCDQDDVWYPEKLVSLHARMRRLETQEGQDRPVLVYSDLEVVDATLRRLAASHFHYAHADRAWRRPGYWLLSHNLIPGCAMMGNRALLERSLPFPMAVEYHDWWLLLCAVSMGHVGVEARPLLSYRQHGANAVGASSHGRKVLGYLSAFEQHWRAARRKHIVAMAQDLALAERLDEARPPEAAWLTVILGLSAGVLAASPWRRLWVACFGPVRRVGLARNLLFCCLALTTRPDPNDRDSHRGGHRERRRDRQDDS